MDLKGIMHLHIQAIVALIHLNKVGVTLHISVVDFFFFFFFATNQLYRYRAAWVVCRSLSVATVPCRTYSRALSQERSVGPAHTCLALPCVLGFACLVLSWPTPVVTPHSLSLKEAAIPCRRTPQPCTVTT